MSKEALTIRKLPILRDELRFCVIGASSFLGTAIDALLQAGLQVVSIASQTPLHQPQSPTETYLTALDLHEPASGIVNRLHLPFVHTPDPNNPASIAAIKETAANAILSVSAPIIRANFLEAFDGLVFNIHGSKRYRGRAGLSWLILNDDHLCEDAWVLHWIDTGIDTGTAIVEQTFKWPKTAYPIDIMAAQRASMAGLMTAFKAAISSGSVASKAQSGARPYFPALKTELDGKIDWRWTGSEIERCVRAFGWPYSGAKTIVVSPDRQTKREIHVARVKIGTAGGLHPLGYGVVLVHAKDGPAEVACKDGSVLIETVRDGAGERPAGDVIRVGCRLSG